MRWSLLPCLLAALWSCEEAEPPPAPPIPDPGAAVDSEQPARYLLALEGEGLRLVDANSGSTRGLPFGAAGDSVTTAISATLRAEPVEQGFVADCAAAYARWEPGPTVYFTDGRFAGWAVRAGAEQLTTMTGIGIGSSRAELESAHFPEVMQSSLGLEFHAGGLAGLLDADGNEGRISHLWAGVVCIAR